MCSGFSRRAVRRAAGGNGSLRRSVPGRGRRGFHRLHSFIGRRAGFSAESDRKESALPGGGAETRHPGDGCGGLVSGQGRAPHGMRARGLLGQRVDRLSGPPPTAGPVPPSRQQARSLQDPHLHRIQAERRYGALNAQPQLSMTRTGCWGPSEARMDLTMFPVSGSSTRSRSPLKSATKSRADPGSRQAPAKNASLLPE